MPVVPFCLMDTLLRCSWMFLLKFVKQEMQKDCISLRGQGRSKVTATCYHLP
uniref:Uncharacterized protein n=1 Tax=Cucumis melo TaxID=3656 RepID=A0A9I9DF68_CUCME